MKEARFLVRLANTDSYQPVDHAALLQKVREVVSPFHARVANLRVTHYALEFDLFGDPEKPMDFVSAVLQPLGKVLTCKRLDLPAGPVDPARVIAEARQLFNEERYWEVHEVIEGAWKKAKGKEKELLQGLILAAAALVHVQRNEGQVVWPMLTDAATRLRDQPAMFYGLDVRTFLNNVELTLRQKKVHFPTI